MTSNFDCAGTMSFPHIGILEQRFWLYALWDESISFLLCPVPLSVLCIETSSTDWESYSEENTENSSLILFPSLRFKKTNFHYHPGRSLCLSLGLFITKRETLDILPGALILHTQRGIHEIHDFWLGCLFWQEGRNICSSWRKNWTCLPRRKINTMFWAFVFFTVPLSSDFITIFVIF